MTLSTAASHASTAKTMPEKKLAQDLARLRIDRSSADVGMGGGTGAPRRRQRRSRLLPWAIAALLAAALLALFSTDLLPFRRPLVAVARARATENGGGPQGGAPILSASGYVVARVRAAVAPEVTGRLVELRVDVGDQVAKGALIGRLADEDLVARAREAEAVIAAAEAALVEETVRRDDLVREAVRQRELLARGLTSQSRHDAVATDAAAADARIASATARLETGRASLNVVRAQIEKMRIRAPFDGTVLEKNAELGEIVGPAFGGSAASGGGVPVVTMADLASTEVEVDVNETYIGRVTPDMPATITLDAYPDRSYPAAVRQIVPTADRQKATVQVKVAFRERDARVLPEMGARVSFLSPAPAAGGVERSVQVWVPREALRHDAQDGTAVYLLREDRVVSTPVEVGPQVGGDVQILSGVGPGERVVVGNEPAVAPGQRVRVREST
jgi:RND family efflux transporter MFP subunit